MAIEFSCDACGTSLKVPETKAGASGKCPKCRAAIVVPDALEVVDDDPWESDLHAADAQAMPPRVEGDSTARKSGRDRSRPEEYQSKTGLVWAITLLMGCYILSTLAYGGASAYQLTLLNKLNAGQEVGEKTLENSDSLVGLPACVNSLTVLALAVVWCLWKAGVNRNARAISGNELEYTPGWAAGCYFVPFANLVWPYNAMKEIWENSDPSVPTGLVGVWWGLWIFNGVIGQLEFRLTMRAETIDEYITATYATLVGVPISLASAGVALALVWKLHGMQESAASGRG